jgi:hypothetical protein
VRICGFARGVINPTPDNGAGRFLCAGIRCLWKPGGDSDADVALLAIVVPKRGRKRSKIEDIAGFLGECTEVIVD